VNGLHRMRECRRVEGAAYSTVTWRSNGPSAESRKANAGFPVPRFRDRGPAPLDLRFRHERNLGHPRADAGDSLCCDAQRAARWRIIHRWERNIGSQVDVREALEQLRCATLLNPGTAVDDEVLLQAGRVNTRALERERNTWVAADIDELLSLTQVPGDDVFPVESDPDAGDLRRTVPTNGDEVGERTRLDQFTCALREQHHRLESGQGARAGSSSPLAEPASP
jgi:hypothetical protein